MVRDIYLATRLSSKTSYGSSVLNDFRLGWSDIDILVLTDKQITEEQAQKLVGLRQALLEKEPGNPYYRSFEGGMLTLDAFLTGKADRVVYWGTSGERITDTYMFDSFGIESKKDVKWWKWNAQHLPRVHLFVMLYGAVSYLLQILWPTSKITMNVTGVEIHLRMLLSYAWMQL